MAKAVVLLFLLDGLPDFNNVMNTTLKNMAPDANGKPCQPTVAAHILEMFGKNIDLPITTEKMVDLENSTHYKQKLKELSDALYHDKRGTDVSNSIEISNEKSLERSRNFIESNYIDNVIKNEDISECEIPPTDYFKHNATLHPSKASFPESAPFSAAIFETVSNVTAQTCGGALVAPHWVLTAASCVNVLGPIFSNSSYQTINTSYIIVIGATNSLKDGTVHNVSEIILHPIPKIAKDSASHPNYVPNQALIRQWLNIKRPIANVKTPSLALLRIEPGLQEGAVAVMENRTDWDGVNARVYGWGLVPNESGPETMMAASLPLTLLSPEKCKTAYEAIENNSTLCLSSNETTGNITRMNAGGPVMVVQDGRVQLLGVALTDGTAPLLASPLSAHRDWLARIIGVL
ncbi:U21-ctenitoxin-Pn1a-like [Choristoneura fumiferana]|uniref:U21-ctenitoxin-Pn1a-like n=1 Tax=Choristoneura fumiferana TaxID=7141 RepID=UPI003D15B9E4